MSWLSQAGARGLTATATKIDEGFELEEKLFAKLKFRVYNLFP